MTAKQFIKQTVGDLVYLLTCAIGLILAFIVWIYEGWQDMSPKEQGFFMGFMSFGGLILIMSILFTPDL